MYSYRMPRGHQQFVCVSMLVIRICADCCIFYHGMADVLYHKSTLGDVGSQIRLPPPHREAMMQLGTYQTQLSPPL